MYQRILVPLDGGTTAEHALPLATGLVSAGTGEIVLVRVVEPRPTTIFFDPAVSIEEELLDQEEAERARDYLEQQKAALQREGVSVSIRVSWGPVAKAILAEARQSGADLVVIVSRAQSGMRRFFGGRGQVGSSILHGVSSAAKLVVPPDTDADSRPQRIVVPLDGRTTSEQAVPHAERIAAAFGSSITLVRVVGLEGAHDAEALASWRHEQPTPTPKTLMAQLARRHDEAQIRRATEHLAGIVGDLAARGLETSARLLVGPVAKGISLAIEEVDADLVVMTSHSRSAVDRIFYGGIAADLLRRVALPIVVVHPDAPEAA